MSTKTRIRFECPTCSAEHDRGYHGAIGMFRCLRCGYFGYGHHADIKIDAEIQADIAEAERIDRALGLVQS